MSGCYSARKNDDNTPSCFVHGENCVLMMNINDIGLSGRMPVCPVSASSDWDCPGRVRDTDVTGLGRLAVWIVSVKGP